MDKIQPLDARPPNLFLHYLPASTTGVTRFKTNPSCCFTVFCLGVLAALDGS